MSEFVRATTPERTGEATFRFVVEDGWQQGRGAFGGLVVASLVRAIEAAEGASDRRVRSVTAELPGPLLVGEAEIRVERLRAGTGVSTWAARTVQGGETVAHAVAVLGKARAHALSFVDVAPPAMIDFASLAPAPRIGPPAPAFAAHFEYRPTGPAPFSGSREARVEGWVRPREPGPARDAAYVAACVDAYWPAIFPRLDAPRPMATIAFTLEVLGGCDGLDPEAPLYHRGVALAATEGYVSERRELFGHDGGLVAQNHQTFVVIK